SSRREVASEEALPWCVLAPRGRRVASRLREAVNKGQPWSVGMPSTPGSFAIALRMTSLGARLGLAASISLFAADIAGQLAPRHPALLAGVTGATSALVAWKVLTNFFRRLGA